MKKWTPAIDPETIPDEVIVSENAKRNARKRKAFRGGSVWSQHRSDALKGCRCAACNAARKIVSETT